MLYHITKLASIRSTELTCWQGNWIPWKNYQDYIRDFISLRLGRLRDKELDSADSSILGLSSLGEPQYYQVGFLRQKSLVQVHLNLETFYLSVFTAALFPIH